MWLSVEIKKILNIKNFQRIMSFRCTVLFKVPGPPRKLRSTGNIRKAIFPLPPLPCTDINWMKSVTATVPGRCWGQYDKCDLSPRWRFKNVGVGPRDPFSGTILSVNLSISEFNEIVIRRSRGGCDHAAAGHSTRSAGARVDANSTVACPRRAF